MRIIDQLDKYMSFKGINDNQVTKKCGLSVGLLGKARKGESDLGKKAVDKILYFYQDINRTWLLTGEGNMLQDCMIKKEFPSTEKIEVSAEAWNVIKQQAESLAKQSEILASKEKQVEELISLLKKVNVPMDGNVKCAAVSGSDLVE